MKTQEIFSGKRQCCWVTFVCLSSLTTSLTNGYYSVLLPCSSFSLPSPHCFLHIAQAAPLAFSRATRHHSNLCAIFMMFSLQQEILERKANFRSFCCLFPLGAEVISGSPGRDTSMWWTDRLVSSRDPGWETRKGVEDSAVSVESADCRFHTDRDMYKATS